MFISGVVLLSLNPSSSLQGGNPPEVPASFNKNGKNLKESGPAVGLHWQKGMKWVESDDRGSERVPASAAQSAGAIEGLGRPDQLARVLRLLLATHLRRGPQSRVVRRRSAGHGAGNRADRG